MTKEQLIELIQLYEDTYNKHYTIENTTYLQDKMKDNMWLAFSGQYELFLYKTLPALFKYDLANIVTFLIFEEELGNMPLYASVDKNVVIGIYCKANLGNPPRYIVAENKGKIHHKIIEVTVNWRLKNGLKKDDLYVEGV